MTLLINVLLVLFNVTFVLASDSYYTAAVVEYYAKDFHPNSRQNVMLNALNHRSIIDQVFSENVKPDIIVFPETGLKDFSVENPVSTIIPSPVENVTPCPGASYYNQSSDLLETLSCTARMYNIYMVVNMLEKYIENSKTYFYNTNVAFDRRGTIIGRYRKHNLYSRLMGLTKPSTPEFSYFDTDFGVRFGMFTCFDIVFKTPAVDLVENYNITHFVFPTHWYSEMPFLTAIQAQYSWAASNNVVLLASGLNCPETESTGSGIYIGSDNSPTSYIQTETQSDFVIVRKVPKNVSHGTINDPGRVVYRRTVGPTMNLPMKSDKEIISFNTELINENENLHCDSSTCRSSLSAMSKTICQGNTPEKFCCHFNYTLESFYDDENSTTVPYTNSGDDFGFNYYRLVVFDGVKDYDGFAKGHLQICAILSCTDKFQNIDSCGNPTYHKQRLRRKVDDVIYVKTGSKFTYLEISAQIRDDAFSIMPNVLYSRSSVNQGSFGSLGPEHSFLFHTQHIPESRMKYATMTTNQSRESTESIGVFGIYARISDETRPSTNNSVGMITSDIVIFILVTIFVFRKYLPNYMVL